MEFVDREAWRLRRPEKITWAKERAAGTEKNKTAKLCQGEISIVPRDSLKVGTKGSETKTVPSIEQRTRVVGIETGSWRTGELGFRLCARTGPWTDSGS